MRSGKFIYALFAALAVCVFDSSAQNLDPTVVVDRAYEGKLMEVHKPALEMAVPDTVMRFDLDFDYSVFDNPYKGSYEFSPYLLSMKPAASADDSRRFYLSAGAGYQLHPELDLIWSPVIKGKGLSLDVYANHRSFIGSYLPCTSEQGAEDWNGYDLLSKGGADLRYDWDKGVLDFGAGYYGLMSRDFAWDRSYNAADASFGLSSKNTSFRYAFDVDYRYAADKVGGHAGAPEDLAENVVEAKGTVGIPTRGTMILFDLGADYASYSGARSLSGGQFFITPHYVYGKGRFTADLGVKVAKTFTSDAGEGYGAKGQFVYPDVSIEFIAVPDAMKIWAKAEGGNRTDTYASVLSSNHHLNFRDRMEGPGFMDFTVERVAASAGLSGRISSGFSYDVYAGYTNYMQGLMDCVILVPGVIPSYGVGYAAYAKWFAGASLAWRGERLSFGSNLLYTDATFAEGERQDVFLLPAAFKGDVSVRYNWKKRVYAGVSCAFSTDRSNAMYSIPAYADLGLDFEYALSRRFSCWLKGGNLLGMNIQRNLGYAEKGPYFTLGIRLNL